MHHALCICVHIHRLKQNVNNVRLYIKVYQPKIRPLPGALVLGSLIAGCTSFLSCTTVAIIGSVLLHTCMYK